MGISSLKHFFFNYGLCEQKNLWVKIGGKFNVLYRTLSSHFGCQSIRVFDLSFFFFFVEQIQISIIKVHI